MEQDFGPDDEGPFFSWLPPEDRLWRHPSEVPEGQARVSSARRGYVASPLSTLRSSIASGTMKVWTVAVVAGLVGAAAASGIGMLTGAFTQQTTVLRPLVSATSEVSLPATGEAIDWHPVEESVQPSIVGITVCSGNCVTAGSGLIVMQSEGDSYVVTDRSIFTAAEAAGNLGSISVTLPSGGTTKGRLVGQDVLSGMAVVEISDSGTIPLQSAQLGSVDDIQLADSVMILGAANLPNGSAFTGSVSAEDETVSLPDGTDMDNLIAVGATGPAAAADGGPLVDQWGQVVGITVNLDPIYDAQAGLTYAMPIDEAYRVTQEMLAHQDPEHPWLGLIDTHDVPSATASSLGIVGGGAQAGSVSPDSPASRAGISSGDIITAFNGSQVATSGKLTSLLYDSEPGQSVSISYVHVADDRTVDTKVQLTNEPGDG